MSEAYQLGYLFGYPPINSRSQYAYDLRPEQDSNLRPTA
jgi:hypothetical protein